MTLIASNKPRLTKIHPKIKLVEFNSPEQKQTIALRNEILREPLGMKLDAVQLKQETQDFHFAAYYKKELVACLVLTPYTIGDIKMRQVAVVEKYQNRGIGYILVKHVEDWAAQKGYRKMFCHARDVAVPFYEKLNYYQIGGPFEEIGIKHFRLEKTI